jgi:cold shock CspA family protein
MESTVCSVVFDKGFGFIRGTGGEGDLFFHCKDLIDLEFDATLNERRVKFDVVNTGRGLRAKNIQPAE